MNKKILVIILQFLLFITAIVPLTESMKTDKQNEIEVTLLFEILNKNNIINDELLKKSIDLSLKENKPVFLFFSIDYCGWCKKQKPILNEIKEDFKEKINFIDIDGKINPDILKDFEVRSFPTMYLIFDMKNNVLIKEKISGYHDKIKLKSFLDNIIESQKTKPFNNVQEIESESVSQDILSSHYDIDIQAVKMLFQSEIDIKLIDIRPEREYHFAHIKNAFSLPLSDLMCSSCFSEIKDSLLADKLIVYGDNDEDSIYACDILIRNGFENVYKMIGGINAWTNAGLSLISENNIESNIQIENQDNTIVMPATFVGCVGETQTFGCDDTITESCILNGDLTCSGHGFKVGAENITLDGNGYTLEGSNIGIGIHLSHINNITVQNFNVENFYTGIHLGDSYDCEIINNSVIGNDNVGISLYHSSNNLVTNNVANNNDVGIEFSTDSDNNNVINNEANNNANYGFFIFHSSYNEISSNTANHNTGGWGIGFYEQGGLKNTFYDNIAKYNDYGLAFDLTEKNEVYSNLFDNNIYGIYCGLDCNYNEFENDNIVTNNDISGIYLDTTSYKNEIDDNFFCWNGLDIDNCGTLNLGDGNTCDTYHNWGYGCTFECSSGNDDNDEDGIPNYLDNCPNDWNPGQEDFDYIWIYMEEWDMWIKIEAPDGVGDVCDNCPETYNPDQLNSDGDSRGDECDNCPNVHSENFDDTDDDRIGDICDNCWTVENPYQGDSDGDCPAMPFTSDPHCGDWCDNCPNVPNPDQANQDDDSRGDACDNCWYNWNSLQEDYDNDCDLVKAIPGYWDGIRWLQDPHCGDDCDNCPWDSNPTQEDTDTDGIGDVCDNCPNHENSDQIDRDSDDVGDACDCNDGYRGPNEEGADCGGICPDVCSSPCIPYLLNGNPDYKIDILFIPDQDYNGDLDLFLEHVEDLINNAYGATPPIDTNMDKLNFYFITYEGDATAGCGGDPPNEIDDPQCDLIDKPVILHQTSMRDCCQGFYKFTAEGVFEPSRSFIHESGHALFRLIDEYSGDTYYEQNDGDGGPPNVWSSRANCRSDASSEGWNPDDCHEFRTGWWKIDHAAPEIMINNQNGFGRACTRRINWIFDNLIYRQLNENNTAEKTIKIWLNINGDIITELGARVAYGKPRDHNVQGNKFFIDLISAEGSLLQKIGLYDPRVEQGEDGSPYGGLADNVDFNVVIPYFENLKSTDVTDSMGEIIGSVDLSEELYYFCDDVDHDDPDCQIMDLDNDGVRDVDDNCPLVYNPDQLDLDGNGIGDVCDHQPDKPEITDGVTEGKIEVAHNYSSIANDQDKDRIYYWFDWGDNSNSGWLGPYFSGEECVASHSWSRRGNYDIKVKVKDHHGKESEWSEPLSVRMPKTKPYNYLLFQRFFEIFPLIEKLINNLISLVQN